MQQNLTSHAALANNRTTISALQRGMACLLILLVMCFSNSSQAYWTPGGGIIGQTPQEACIRQIKKINDDNPSTNTYKWAANSPLMTKSGELPGGFYNCRVKPVDKTTEADVSYPPATQYTIYTACTLTDETPARDYGQPSGCIQMNSPYYPVLLGSPCPTCIEGDTNGGGGSTGASPAMGGAVSASNGAVNASSTIPTGMGSMHLKGSVGSIPSAASTSIAPVDLAMGNVSYSATDYETAGPNKMAFARFFNTMENGSFATSLGKGWRHTFDRYVAGDLGGNAGNVERADGRRFQWSGGTSSSGALTMLGEYSLYRTISGSAPYVTYTLVTSEDTVETYTAATTTDVAQLQTIAYRNGYTLTLSYSSGVLASVTDSYSRTLTLNYTDGYLTSITTPDSTTVSYGYGSSTDFLMYLGVSTSSSRLSSVTYPDATSNPVTYAYEGSLYTDTVSSTDDVKYYANSNGDPISCFRLLSVTDQNGRKSQEWTYDKYGRATQTKGYNGTQTTSISYNGTDGSRAVTYPSGIVETYAFSTAYGLARNTSVSRPAIGSTPASARACNYDYAYGYVSGCVPFFSGSWYYNTAYDTYTINGRRLPTQTIENYFGSSGGAITTTYTWTTATASSPYPSGYVYRLPASISEGGLRTTSFTYDSKGNMLTKTLTDNSGQGQAARTWTYTYDSTGNVLTAQDPRGNTTTFTYSSGRLATITNALSQTVTFSNFTGGGRPQTVTDANGVAHTITYDSRQRITGTSVTVGGVARDTTYTWNLNDELASILNPDSTSITYGYPYEVTSNPLTRTVTDAAGNVATTTMDSGMRPITVKTQDSGSTTALHRNATYDTIGRLKTESNFDNTKTTTYNYDLNSNVTSVVDPRSNTTSFAYDFHQRRTSMTDANSGVTSWTYTNLHDVASVTAPTTTGSPAPVTTYTRNGFGEVKQEVSPDRGTTTYVYDNMGNLTQKTDAASVVTNYTYDALNRLATVAYPSNSALNVTYTYDESGHGKGVGRLTSVSDAAGTLSLSYDERGAVTAKNRTTSSGNMNIASTYNAAGKLASLTYPSGLVVSYTRDTAGNIASVSYTPPSGSSTSLASYSSGYLPFGPVKSVALANGVTTTYAYDKDLLMTGISDNSSLQGLTYTYDNAGNLTNIADSLNAANGQTLGYDVIDRLTSAVSGSGGYGNHAYAYDKNGNRTSTTINSTTTSYTTATSKNRLTAVGSQSLTYDNKGNITALSPAMPSGVTTLAYGADNRLASVSGSSGTLGAYTYDGFGTRTIKSAGGNTTLYVTGGSNQLLEEKTGSTTIDYIYANGVPIAQYTTGSGLVWLHTDQRGAPVKATNGSKTVQWATSYDAFGQTVGLTNPGSLTQNMRLPGQLLDAESGLYNNGLRDYIPSLARYGQSDPIGLAGGLNTYAYVGGMPFKYTDPWGTNSVTMGRRLIFDIGKPLTVVCTTTPTGRVVCAAAAVTAMCIIAGYEAYKAYSSQDEDTVPSTGGDGGDRCDKMYDDESQQCGVISKVRGAPAGARCYATAAARYAACIKGDPLPPLDVYNN